MEEVGLINHSPHKFRHGFAVYCLQNAQDMGDFKAISQNLMHANLSITDGIYGIFSQEEIKNRITGLNNYSEKKMFSDYELNKLAVLVADQMIKRQNDG
jgi:integrase